MEERGRSAGETDPTGKSAPVPPPDGDHVEPPGRADRDPEEGPGLGGGSALDQGDPAADEEVGGGD